LTCINCFETVPSDDILRDFLEDGQIPLCHCGGVYKPNIILFGEQLPVRAYTRAKQAARECDLMLVAGSSLEVAPAGDLPLLAHENGDRLIIVNLQPTHADKYADIVIHGDVVEILPQLAAQFVGEESGD